MTSFGTPPKMPSDGMPYPRRAGANEAAFLPKKQRIVVPSSAFLQLLPSDRSPRRALSVHRACRVRIRVLSTRWPHNISDKVFWISDLCHDACYVVQRSLCATRSGSRSGLHKPSCPHESTAQYFSFLFICHKAFINSSCFVDFTYPAA